MKESLVIRKRKRMKAGSKIFNREDSIKQKGFALVDSLILLAILAVFIIVLVITFGSFEMPDKAQALSTSPHTVQTVGTSY